MGKGKTQIQLWDSSVFISWLKAGKQDNRSPEDLDGIEEAIRNVVKGNVKLVVSCNVYSEVLTNDISPETAEKLQLFLKRRNVSVIPVSAGVAKKAGMIREYYRDKKKHGGNVKCIKATDAQHLATALLYHCDVVFAFDKDDMLNLNGNVAGQSLIIMKPPPPAQTELKFGDKEK